MNQQNRGSATRTNSVSAWLTHSTKTTGAGYLRGWKKEGTLNVFLHMAQPPTFLWQHQWPTIVPIEDKQHKGPPVRHVWGRPYTCGESEAVLKNRKRDNGRRVVPYRDCGLCRFIEWVRVKVNDGEIDPLKVLFNYQADDPKETTVLHAGGLYNLFSQDDLDEDIAASMRRAGVTKKTAWRESGMAKQNMLFLVVNASSPGDGLQKTIETGLLGDKVRECVMKAMKEYGAEGNPFNEYEQDDNTKPVVAKGNPYCIQFEYLEAAQEFSKKYAATRLSRVPCTPAIRKLIDGPAPSIDEDLAPFNAKAMRATLERHCMLKDVPWDGLFCLDAAETRKVDAVFGLDRRDDEPEPEEQDAPRGASVRETAPDDQAPAVDEEEDAEVEQCKCTATVKVRKGKKTVEEECGNVMLATDAVCSKCGAEYDVEGDEEAEPEPAKPTPVAAKPAAQAPKRAGAKALVPESDEERSRKAVEALSEIPF